MDRNIQLIYEKINKYKSKKFYIDFLNLLFVPPIKYQTGSLLRYNVYKYDNAAMANVTMLQWTYMWEN